MIEFLVDRDEYAPALAHALGSARRRALVQTMSFEGDRAGRLLAAAFSSTACGDRRLLIDSFSKVVVSERLAVGSRFQADSSLRRELTATRAVIRRLLRNGTGVRFCAPLGMMMRRLPARNHKKSVIADDVAFIGGVNFSDHNFGWHDMMVRIESRAAADFLAMDFDDTWHGRARSRCATFGPLHLDIAAGTDNRSVFGRLLDRLDAAQRSIVVHSPYLTFPFTRHLVHARRRGVHVTVITPRLNTLPVLTDYITALAARHRLHLRVFPGRMSHLKAILIDDRELVFGSSNFDYLSYLRHEEIIAYCVDSGVIAEFRRRVLEPDLACSEPADAPKPDWWLNARVHAAGYLLALVSR